MTLGKWDVNRVYCCEALELLRGLPDNSVSCIVTSPPYFGLRSYTDDDEREIGKEETPEEYVAALVGVFREARRVLRKDGTLWLNLGDSYASGEVGRHDSVQGRRVDGKPVSKKFDTRQQTKTDTGLSSKNLLMIPARVALALQADGWYLRSDIIWAKPNPMPESVTDRPTKSHEHVFLLTKNPRYYYDADAIKEDAVNGDPTHPRGSVAVVGQQNAGRRDKQSEVGKRQYTGFNERWDNRAEPLTRRNKRDVWTIPTKPYKGAHFAVMPPELVRLCVLAGCPEGGVVLDPFMGSGTVARVAHRLGLRYLGCDINPAYVEMANKSLQQRSLYEMETFVELEAQP